MDSTLPDTSPPERNSRRRPWRFLFTFLLISLVVLAILAAIPLLLLSARGAGPGLGNQPGVLGGALGPCPASPAVSHIESGDAGLYATAIDGVYRYSVQQGHLNLIWHAVFKPSPEAIMTQVVVVDDEAVFVEDSGSGLYVDALNTPNGRLRWRTPLGGGEVSNMLLADRTVFVESDGPGGGQFTIRAFNISSGSPRWSYTFTSNDEENEGGYFPGLGAVANGVVYSGAGDYLLALNASTGKAVWKVQFNSSEALLPPEIMGGVLFDELISTVGSTSAEIAFDPTTGRELWQTTPFVAYSPPGESEPTAADGMVYFGNRSGLISAVNAANGAPEWHRQMGRTVTAPPVVDNGILYVGGAPFSNATTDPNIVHGEILALDAATGRQLWSYRVPSSDYDGFTPLLISGGMVYVATGLAYIYTVSAKTGHQTARTQVRPYTCISTDPALTLVP